jgi:hypothetical protein
MKHAASPIPNGNFKAFTGNHYLQPLPDGLLLLIAAKQASASAGLSAPCKGWAAQVCCSWGQSQHADVKAGHRWSGLEWTSCRIQNKPTIHCSGFLPA